MKKYFIGILVLLILSFFGLGKYFYEKNEPTVSIATCIASACINFDNYDSSTKFYVRNTVQSNNCERILKQSKMNVDDSVIYNYFIESYKACVNQRNISDSFVQKDVIPVETVPFDIKKHLFGKMDTEGLIFGNPKDYA